MTGNEADMPGLAEAELAADAASPADESAAIQELVAKGDYRHAVARCARTYGSALGRLCMAFTSSQAESEEIVQETLIAAYDGFAQYRGEGSVRAWLFGIARRMCGRHVEMRARRDARLRLVHDTGRSVEDASDLVLERERALRARRALGKLKPSEREAVVLRYEAGLSFRDVATACGVDEAAARKRVSRALSRLRADLSEEES